LDGHEVTDDSRTIEAGGEERDLIYDSMEAMVADSEEVIELFDISAAVDQTPARPSGSNYAIATSAPSVV
jgi:hypothetical protein